MSGELLAGLRMTLPRHAAVLDALIAAVEADERWQWLELGCSVAAGRGDEWSDLDIAVGARSEGEDDLPVEDAVQLVRSVGPVTDLLVHHMPGRNSVRRIAAEFGSGVQLDLVVMPAATRAGLPPDSVALVDKDGTLAEPWTPEVIGQPDPATLREWAFLAWWALSDTAKYLARGSVFEAADRIAEARRLALQLHAAAQRVDYPLFGLTSILDTSEPVLPMWIEETFGEADAEAMRRAALAAVRLLRDATTAVEMALGVPLEVPLRDPVIQRLEAITSES